MGALDPVSWDAIEAVAGPPAPEVTARVEARGEDLRGEDPYVAVKTIHDELAGETGPDAAVPDQGEVFITTYLLERDGVITPDGDVPSIVDRRPDEERLRELFWGETLTMWWIAVLTGTHWALVRYWLHEDGVPLRERNFSAETVAEIRAYRET